jgi:lysophospholipase L1-like esterase
MVISIPTCWSEACSASGKFASGAKGFCMSTRFRKAAAHTRDNRCGFALLTAAAFAFVLFSSTSPAGAFNPHPNPIRIMPLGDSITIGAGDPDRQGYRRILYRDLVKKGYDVDFVGAYTDGQSSPASFDDDHQGVGGLTKEQLAALTYNALVANPADIVLLHIGTNQPTTNAGPVETILNEIDRASASTRVLLARIINKYNADGTPMQTVTTYNQNVVAMAQARQGDDIRIVDMESSVLYPQHYVDLAHPNTGGYRFMANAWLSALLASLPQPQGIASYWKLGDNGGGRITDSKLLNHGMCTECPLVSSGQVGDGQLFSSSTVIIVPPDDLLSWSQADSYTVELWFRKEAVPAAGEEVLFASQSIEGNGEMLLGITASEGRNRVFFSARSRTGQVLIQAANRFLDDEWHHVALVRTPADGRWDLYVDGVREGQYIGSFALQFDPAPWISLGNIIDSDRRSGAKQFLGTIDEFAISNRSISGSEVLAHYQNGFSGQGYYYTGSTAPYIKAVSPLSIKEGEAFSHTVVAVGRPAPALTLLDGPDGMSINTSSGLLTWGRATVGEHEIVVRASNSVAATQRSLTLTVSPVGSSGDDPAPSGGSGGGCHFGPKAGFGLEWLLLISIVLWSRLRRGSAC